MRTSNLTKIYHEGAWHNPRPRQSRITRGGAFFGPLYMKGSKNAFQSWLDQHAPKTDWEAKAAVFETGGAAIWFPCVHRQPMFNPDEPMLDADGNPVDEGFVETMALSFCGQKTDKDQVLLDTIDALSDKLDEGTILRAAAEWKNCGYKQAWFVVGDIEANQQPLFCDEQDSRGLVDIESAFADLKGLSNSAEAA